VQATKLWLLPVIMLVTNDCWFSVKNKETPNSLPYITSIFTLKYTGTIILCWFPCLIYVRNSPILIISVFPYSTNLSKYILKLFSMKSGRSLANGLPIISLTVTLNNPEVELEACTTRRLWKEMKIAQEAPSKRFILRSTFFKFC